METAATLEDQVREILATVFGVPIAEVSASASSAEWPIWDSLYHFTVIAALEDRFGVTYTSDEIPTMINVAAIAETTAAHLRVASSR